MKINVRQPKQTCWGNQYDLHPRRNGRHQQHCLQPDHRSCHVTAYFRAQLPGQDHDEKHIWRKIAAIKTYT